MARFLLVEVAFLAVLCLQAVNSQTPYPVRLEGGFHPFEGRVEIQVDGVWGTLCDMGFDNNDAEVICRQFGYGQSTEAHPTCPSAAAEVPFHFTNVGCVGTESNLVDCTLQAFVDECADHTGDVCIRCTPNATENALRLVGGSSLDEGTLQIMHGGAWGSVCDSDFDANDAEVACRQMGYTGTTAFTVGSSFGALTDPILLSDLGCTSDESSLTDCINGQNWGVLADGCDSTSLAGVSCMYSTYEYRLTGGESADEGIIEVQFNGEWGAVCIEFHDADSAEVACSQMGYLRGEVITIEGTALPTTHLDLYWCYGFESSLNDCLGHFGTCLNTSSIPAVRCYNEAVFPIRLQDGPSDHEGRVEIFAQNLWGTICGNNFDQADADVICRELGFPSAMDFSTTSLYGPGAGTIWLDNVGCTGTEYAIEDCMGPGLGVIECNTTAEVGVLCDTETAIPLRLTGGTSSADGMLEVYRSGQWYAVCSSGFDPRDAIVVCRSLRDGMEFLSYSSDRSYSGSYWFSNLGCLGNETSIALCLSDMGPFDSCGGFFDGAVALECIAPANDTGGIADGTVRLLGAEGGKEGRVEVFFHGHWGSICDDSWDLTDANVVCKQLGFDGAINAYGFSQFGQGTGPIWYDEVRCTGDEIDINDCPSNDLGDNDCSHFEDAGVSCYNNEDFTDPFWSVQLVGGDYNLTGRLQISYAGRWGDVCGAGFDLAEAQVVCRQLGVTDNAQIEIFENFDLFGYSFSGDHLLNNLACGGSEANLNECPHSGLDPFCSFFDLATPMTCDTGLKGIRLVAAGRPNVGRLEVNYAGIWGVVCDDAFGLQDANVACKQLGFEGAEAFSGLSEFGSGSGIFWLDDVSCTGEEDSLEDCGNLGWGNHNCFTSEAVSLTCAIAVQYSNYSVRLVDGPTSHEGRVEVYFGGQWGTICNDGWSISDAEVVCRQLHYNGVVSTPNVRFYGAGERSSPIHLTNVNCDGDEELFSDCKSFGFDTSVCSHSEDVGVMCAAPDDYQIRLRDGISPNQGRVEVNFDGEWGTVCDNSWNIDAAHAVCRQLGYLRAERALRGLDTPNGDGRIWLGDVACNGDENMLNDCPHSGFGQPPLGCSHTDDAGVWCTNLAIEPGSDMVNIRLVNNVNNNTMEGRLELYYNSQWGTVCIDSFGYNDAYVACRNLFPDSFGDEYTSDGSNWGPLDSENAPVWLSELGCDRSEINIGLCSHPGFGTSECTHNDDVYLKCTGVNPVGNFSTRLVDGPGPYQGQVEVYHDGRWGVVCDDFFGNVDADVVCRSLGYPRAVRFYTLGHFDFNAFFWMDDVQCDGSEEQLYQCSFAGFGNHNCFYFEPVGVECFDPSGAPPNGGEFSLRLAGGATSYEGRLEIYYNSTWGTICNSGWTDTAADVTCRELGFNSSRGIQSFGSGEGPIWLSGPQCVGSEQSITDCFFSNGFGMPPAQCSHDTDVGLLCQPLQERGEIRLVNGRGPYEGRLEVFLNEAWGTVCDDLFGDRDAAIVCGQLGYSTEGARGIGSSVWGSGDGPIWLSQVTCGTDEATLLDCQYSLDTGNCGHFADDVSVVCKTDPTEYEEGEVRLVDGDTEQDGRLEIYYKGLWGTVCDDFFSLNGARVVCQQLGYQDGVAFSSSVGYPEAYGPISLHSVQCNGDEDSLLDCSNSDDFNAWYCLHNEDLRVRCTDYTAPRISQVRLFNGYASWDGRLEIFTNETWHTVCRKDFTRNDAKVACNQLGWADVKDLDHAEGLFDDEFTDPIFREDFQCKGDENSLGGCEIVAVDQSSCSHVNDTALRCLPEPREVLAVYLEGGSTPNQGVVRVLHNGAYGGICHTSSWDYAEADVICQAAGFPGAVRGESSAYFNIKSPSDGTVWLASVDCVGTESGLKDCNYGTIANTSCTDGRLAAVICLNDSAQAPQNRDVRLSEAADRGRVELFFDNDVGYGWGTACGFSVFGINEAVVICRTLGFASVQTFEYVFFSGVPSGSGPLGDLVCQGNENHTNECVLQQVAGFCSHFYDIYLECAAERDSPDLGVRLVDGPSESEGRVEVNHDGVWGTVCDDSWGTEDANVVCRQLGYLAGAEFATGFAFYGQGSGEILLDDVNCQGHEENIGRCIHGGVGEHNCAHYEDAGLKCNTSGYYPPPPAVRLSGQVSTAEGVGGRVELFVDGAWTAVCDNGWGLRDATVACRHLGFTRAGRSSIDSEFGPATGVSISVTEVNCFGDEDLLTDCQYRTDVDNSICDYANTAGVFCAGEPTGVQECDHGTLKLSGSTAQDNGFVLMCFDGNYSTICNDYWGDQDAQVVCRQLGLPSDGAVARSRIDWAIPTEEIAVEIPQSCQGSEGFLTDCGVSPIPDENTNGCASTFYAGVQCGVEGTPCTSLGTAASATVTSTILQGKQVETISCWKGGFEPIQGTSTRTCNNNGQWDYTGPFGCQARTCTSPATPDNAFKVPADQTSFRVNFTFALACYSGYEPVGVTYTYQCLWNGDSGVTYWEGEALTCVPQPLATAAGATGNNLGVGLGVAVPLIIIVGIVIALVAFVVVYMRWRTRGKDLEDTAPIVYESESDQMRDFLEFGNPLYDDEHKDPGDLPEKRGLSTEDNVEDGYGDDDFDKP